MKLIKSPNDWSCAVTAAAMLFDRKIEKIIEFIGHDGSKIINPDLESPGCYEGFALQNIVEYALFIGFSLTPIETLPVQTSTGVDEYDVEIRRYTDAESRLQYHLTLAKGLLVGQSLCGLWHCVAWDGEKIYDPVGEIYDFDECEMSLQSFWRCHKIKSF